MAYHILLYSLTVYLPWLNIFLFSCLNSPLANQLCSLHTEHLMLSLFVLDCEFDIDLLSLLWSPKISWGLFIPCYTSTSIKSIVSEISSVSLLKFSFPRFAQNWGFLLYGNLPNLPLLHALFCFSLPVS